MAVDGGSVDALHPYVLVLGGGKVRLERLSVRGRWIAIGAGNDSESNRFRLVIAVKRCIALDSAEDLLIRNWIAANDGASL